MLQFNNSLLILVLFSTFLHESAEYSSFCLKMDWPPYPLWRHIRHYVKRSRTGKNTSENKWTIGSWKKEFSSSKSSGKNPRKPHEDGCISPQPRCTFETAFANFKSAMSKLSKALEHLQPASKKLPSRILSIPCFFSMSTSWYPPESLTKLQQQTSKNLLGCHTLKTII